MNIALLSALGLHPYRTVELVEKNLDISVFQECADLNDGVYTIRFSIDSQGQASLLEGEGCFSAIERISFSKSPTSKDTFTWNVIHQDDVLFPQILRKENHDVVFPGIFASDKEKLLPPDGKK